MARHAGQSDMSFIEKHVEKLVLGAAAGLLLFAVWHWVLSSPRRVPLRGPGARAQVNDVPPDKADDALLNAAQRVDRRHGRQRPSSFELPDIASRLDGLRNDPFDGGTMIAVGQPRKPLAGEFPLIQDTIGRLMTAKAVEFASLAPKPSTPVAEVYRELADTPDGPKEWYVGRMAGTYSLDEATKAWRAYARKKARLISFRKYPVRIVGVEIEVQVADGANADWDAIKPQPARLFRLPGTIAGDQGADDQRDDFPPIPPTCDEQTYPKVLADLEIIDSNLEELLQPTFHSILDQSQRQWQWVSWQRNLPAAPLKATGSEGLEQRVEPGAVPRPGARIPPRGVGAPSEVGRPPRRGTRPPRGAGRTAEDEAYLRAVRGRLPDGAPSRGEVPSRTDPRRRPAPRRTPVPPRGGARPGPAKPGDGQDQPEPETKIVFTPTPLAQQLQNLNVLIWGHDVALKPGKAYRYRIRVKLLNPLLGRVKDMATTENGDPKGEPTDEYTDQAWLTTVDSPWSDWSNVVRAVRPMDFFLVYSKRKALRGPRANQGTVKVAVFTRELGQLVSHEFVVDRGGPIGQAVTKKLKNPPPSALAKAAGAAKPADEHQPYSTRQVDFTTGAVVVDLDFRKRVFKAGQEIRTTEVVYLDGQGRLSSCLWIKNLPDKAHAKALYARLKAEVDALAAEAAAAAGEATAGTRETSIR